MAVDQPWLLLALGLVVLPLLRTGRYQRPQPWLAVLPRDGLSLSCDGALKALAIVAVSSLVLGLAGLHRQEVTRERIGKGANMVLLLDRSSSMDNNFAGKTPSGKDESKSAAAKRLLTGFVDQRPADRIGVAAYSTSPLFIMPLTENKAAVKSAIAAMVTPSLAYTHVAKGLAMALSFFQDQSAVGSRIIVLISDGAAALTPDDEQKLRTWFKDYQVRLYWVFLRTAHSPGIHDNDNGNPQAYPEHYLHQFFSSLDTPYQAYEAESPDALQKAIADIDQLENQPMPYKELLPRQDLAGVCYGVAGICLVLLLTAKTLEIR